MFINYGVLTRLVVIFLDSIVTILSFFVAIYVRNISLPLPFFDFFYKELGYEVHEIELSQYFPILLIIIIVWRGLSGYQEASIGSMYTQRFLSLKTDILIVLKTVVFGCLILLSIAFIIKSRVPRTFIVFFGVINFMMLSIEKTVLHQSIKYLRKKGKSIKEAFILGTGDVAEHFIDSVRKHSDWGLRISGLICKDESDVGKELFGYKIVGSEEKLVEMLHSHHIDELVIALPAKYLGKIEEVMAICDKEGIPVSIISPFFKNLISKARTELVHGFPVIEFLPVQRNDLELALKRIIDIIVSSIGLVLLAPLFVIIAVLIKLESPGPVFYRWKILGLNKRPLTSYKFRTMAQDADKLKEALMDKNEMTGAVFKMKDDPRITRVGRWLRKYSLDELPQLWSVFKGDLSLVGPRPPLQTEMEKFEGWHRRKLSVKPGITCLWQINGRNTITDFDEWMRLDLKYIDNWSFWLDLKILFKTISAVFKGTGR